MGDDSTPNEHKGHKRQFSNSFDNNQNDGPRGDTPAKFRRESFGDRSPFNRGGNNRGFRGGDRGFRGGGRGGGRGGFRGSGSPSNFNRGGFRGTRGFNNSRGGFRGNRGFNNSNRGGFRDGNDRQSFNSDKLWQQRNNFQNRDNKKTDFEENDAAVNKNKKKVFVDDEQPEQLTENGSDVEESGSGSEDSSSEDEMVPQQQNGTTNGAVDETDSSDSEDEEDSVEGEQPKQTAKNEVMDSSESEEEIEVNNSSKVQKQVESRSDDEMEANGAQDDSDSDSEENKLVNARENNENKNKAAKASITNSTTHGAVEPNPCKIVISRFPPTLKKVHIQKFFEKYGKVREVSLCVKKYDIFGYVIFETPEAAVGALEVNGMQYEGHIISVQQPWADGKPIVEPDRTVCLLHVQFGTYRETLWNLFEPLCGPIEMVLVQGNTAYIQFESSDSKQIALHMKHVVVNGKSYKIVSSVESPQRTPKPHDKFESRGKFGPRGRFGGKPGVRRFGNHSNDSYNAPRWSKNSNNAQAKDSGKEIKIIKNKSDNSFTIKLGS